MEIKYINRTTGKIETEQPPAEELIDFLYNHPFGEKAVLPIAKRDFVTEWYGKAMDRSLSKKRIQPFVDSLNIDMSEVKKKVSEFETFNEFFYRELKPGARKIEEGLVSPGDGKALAFPNVSQVKHFFVKGRRFTLGEFLKDDELVVAYHDASMLILRLAPDDYHRYHFPLDGVPSASEEVDGTNYSVSPIALESNFTRVFGENKKEICKLSTEQGGEILIVPVGATMVGCINATYVPGQPVARGDEMGYFAFGGSSIVLLFSPKHFRLDQDIVENTQKKLETQVKMGEKVASLL